MKKLFSFLTIGFLGIIIFHSCDKSENLNSVDALASPSSIETDPEALSYNYPLPQNTNDALIIPPQQGEIDDCCELSIRLPVESDVCGFNLPGFWTICPCWGSLGSHYGNLATKPQGTNLGEINIANTSYYIKNVSGSPSWYRLYYRPDNLCSTNVLLSFYLDDGEYASIDFNSHCQPTVYYCI